MVSIALVVMVLTIVTSAAVVKGSKGTLDDIATVSPRLWVPAQIAPIEAFRAEGVSPELAARAAAWDRFITAHGTQWSMMVDRVSGMPALIEGGAIPWVPGNANSLTYDQIGSFLGQSGRINEAVLDRIARAFLASNLDLLPIASEDLQLVPGATGEFGGYLWYVQYQQTFAGIPVEGSSVVFRVNSGNLIQFGAEKVAPVNLDPVPSFDLDTARAILAGYAGGLDANAEWLENGRISIVPAATADGMGLEHRLVYNLVFRHPGAMGTWAAKIDAHSGEILSFADDNKYGSVTGGVYPVTPVEAEVVRPFPWLTVTNGTTKYSDLGGNYTFATGTASAALTGKYVKVTDTCGTSSLSTSTSPGNLAFGSSTGTDCTTPGVGGAGNTHAARSGYYALTSWKVKAMTWLPSNTWLQGQVTDNVNLNQTCNAYWNGSSINMFKSGGGCRNSGELPTVVLHEIGHGLDSNDGNSSADGGTGESYGDTNGFLMTHDSCMGSGFFSDGSKCSGYGDACTQCTGIRDVDYAKHTSNTPHTPLNFVKTKCPTGSCVGPCNRECHCEGYIGGEAAWDLAARALPAAGYDSNTSWFILERLFYLSRATSTGAYTCNTSTFASDGCGTSSWFTTFRAVDDTGDGTSNGTPHAAAIYSAFNAHAIGCSTAAGYNTNQTSCATLAQPVLTATAGAGQVGLSWAAVTNATRYWVMRNEISTTAGLIKIAEVTATSYTDTAVAPGITYYYSLLPLTATASCFGNLAAVKSATPTSGGGGTYSISGTVTGATSVTMTLSGAGTGTVTTDGSGNYTFASLANGSYTVTPTKGGYTFSPVNLAVTIASANQTGKNFTATAVPTYSITGTVSGAIASGVTMTLTGAASATTTTATDGTYTFATLANGSYTVTPSKTGYTFSPTSTAVTIASANQTGKNFTSTLIPSGDIALTSGVGVSTGAMALQAWKYYSIVVPSGATSLGVTLTGLSADLDLYDQQPASAGGTGAHPTTSVYTGRSYNGSTTSETLTHASPIAGTWCIGVYAYAAGTATVTATVTTGTATYSISGNITGATSVTVACTGKPNVTTDGSGNYSFTGLANGTYTITPSKTGYTFAPTSTSVTISGANVTGKNFVGTATTTTYSISGTVSGATSVTVACTGQTSVTTSGAYTFSGLANGTYTVTPSKSGYTFSPTSTVVTISGANQTGKNFVGTATGGDTALTSGVGVSGSVALQGWVYYTIAVPSGATNLGITLTGLSADIDLFVNNSATHPTTSSYYGKSENGGTTSETLSYATPTVATWSIGVYGYAAGNYTVTATVSTGGGSTTLFTNGLESTTGWTQVDTSGTAGTWSVVASGTNPTCSKHGGSYMGMFNSYNAASGSATRYYNATTFNSSSYTTVTLTFWMYHDTGYTTNADKVQVQVSQNSTTTWTSVGSAINRYDGTTGWKQHTISLSSNKGTTVRVAFLATSAYGNNMFLDDVTVVGQ
jgi:hypothetical protein